MGLPTPLCARRDLTIKPHCTLEDAVSGTVYTIFTSSPCIYNADSRRFRSYSRYVHSKRLIDRGKGGGRTECLLAHNSELYVKESNKNRAISPGYQGQVL